MNRQNRILSDEQYMQIALRLATRGLGNTFPNPAVGCVIMQNNQIIGRGWTAPSGRPHAETQAISQAKENSTDLSKATAYVTLEPCSHSSKTPPCAKALIDAKIGKVIIATTDPNPLVSGKGIAMLEDAEITVINGVCKEDADYINAGFFSHIQHNRPLVTLKLALTTDGRICTPEGQSPWITGKVAQDYAHILRKEYDAIMVGNGTVIADNPSLTCRLNGLEEQSPLRVIIDRNLKTSRDSNIVNGDSKTLIFSHQESDKYPDNVEIITQSSANNRHQNNINYRNNSEDTIDIPQVLSTLSNRGITRLLVEGGEKIAQSMLAQNLIDRIIIIQSTKINGDKKHCDFRNWIEGNKRFKASKTRKLGNDILTVFTKK